MPPRHDSRDMPMIEPSAGQLRGRPTVGRAQRAKLKVMDTIEHWNAPGVGAWIQLPGEMMFLAAWRSQWKTCRL